MTQNNENEFTTIKSLYDESKALGAEQAHLLIKPIFHDETAVGVVSVYIGAKPDHMILAELFEWAETNGNGELIDKIQDIAEDMSFLQED